MIMLNGEPHSPTNRPFRFEVACLSYDTFPSFLQEKWNKDAVLPTSLQYLTPNLHEWNKETFGNIFHRKKELLARLNGIQNSPTYGRSRFLDFLEKELQDQLALTLHQEECLWFQKSRSQRIVDGDRNTKYYHTKTIIRRRKNQVRTLCTEENGWEDDPGRLKEMIRDYFVNLFLEDNAAREPLITKTSYLANFADHHEFLGARATQAEVKKALFAMGPHKAPSEDGYPAVFFQNCWQTVGMSLHHFVSQVWDNPTLIAQVNNTLLALIPKVDKQEFVSQFRPIALCNVVYKLITKIVVNRIKPFLDGIISPFQSSFIPGQNIHHNIIIAPPWLE